MFVFGTVLKKDYSDFIILNYLLYILFCNLYSFYSGFPYISQYLYSFISIFCIFLECFFPEYIFIRLS